ncbi:MAG: lysophospholipid acyltransferase family protein [Rhizobiaceae bacterium]
MGNVVRLCLVFVLFVVATVPLLPFQFFAVRIERFWFRSLPHLWHKYICWLLGLNVKVKGAISRERPLLLIANHASYKDVLVLGSIAELSFIAKDEVAKWPLFGFLAKLQRTVFIDRKTKRDAGNQSLEIAERLKAGDILVLFPEGTTSDGNRVFPFKSSLFGAAKMALDPDAPDAKVFVQPVSIAYVKRHGIPLGRYHRPIAGWPGTVGLFKHLKGVAMAGSISVEVTFGEPVVYTHHTNRKRLAQKVEATVRTMHEASLYPVIGRSEAMQR